MTNQGYYPIQGMENVSFTGTQNMSEDSLEHVDRILDDLDPKKHRLITGGCIGFDELIAWRGTERGFKVHTCLPSNRSKVDPFWADHCESFEEVDGDYMTRNDRLVELAAWMIATPKTPREELRSGTWATIRRCKKAGKRIYIFPLRK